MSSIAEHLAAFEFYKANGQHQLAADEGYMFLQVHWQELIDTHSPSVMAIGRDEFERRIREQHPDVAERLVKAWRAALPPAPTQEKP